MADPTPVQPERPPDWSTQWSVTPLGAIRNAVAELGVHAQRLQQLGRRPRLLISPCGTKTGNVSSFLRAYSLGEILRRERGYRVSIIPPRLTLSQRQRLVRRERPDVVLIQLERHPLNRPRFYESVPVVFDIDDADFLWDHARALVEECCRDSAAVVAGSRFVANWAQQHNPNVKIIWTGALREPVQPPTQMSRRNVVAWGHSCPENYPAEAEFIQDVLIRAAREVDLEFWLFGVKEARDGVRLTGRLVAAGIPVRVFPLMSFEAFSTQLEEVAIGIQVLATDNPYSQGKSFGKILNYLAAGTVIIASEGADHSLFFDSWRNGVLASSQEAWADAIVRLLKSPAEREHIARQAFSDFRSRLTGRAMATQYDAVLRSVMAPR